MRPLHVWAFDRSLVRFGQHEYPSERPASSNWARTAFADKSRYVIKEYTPLWRLPYFETHLAGCDGSAACAMRAALGAHGYDGAGLWRRMQLRASEPCPPPPARLARARRSKKISYYSAY